MIVIRHQNICHEYYTILYMVLTAMPNFESGNCNLYMLSYSFLNIDFFFLCGLKAFNFSLLMNFSEHLFSEVSSYLSNL